MGRCKPLVIWGGTPFTTSLVYLLPIGTQNSSHAWLNYPGRFAPVAFCKHRLFTVFICEKSSYAHSSKEKVSTICTGGEDQLFIPVMIGLQVCKGRFCAWRDGLEIHGNTGFNARGFVWITLFLCQRRKGSCCAFCFRRQEICQSENVCCVAANRLTSVRFLFFHSPNWSWVRGPASGEKARPLLWPGASKRTEAANFLFFRASFRKQFLLRLFWFNCAGSCQMVVLWNVSHSFVNKQVQSLSLEANAHRSDELLRAWEMTKTTFFS